MADKEAAPTTDEAIVVCLHPDFCKRGDSVVAYDIHAKQSDDVAHSEDVMITGCWASHDEARLKTVYEDSPGDAGVQSGCVEGYARPVKNSSPTVLVNGKGCVRHDTEYEMNCNGPDGPHNTTGKMVYERGGGSAQGSTGASLEDVTADEAQFAQGLKTEARGGFFEDGIGYDLAIQGGEFWDGFQSSINASFDALVDMASDPLGTAEGMLAAAQRIADDPFGTAKDAYDASRTSMADAFEQIANGDAARVAGGLAAFGAEALVGVGGAARGGRIAAMTKSRHRSEQGIGESSSQKTTNDHPEATSEPTKGDDGVVVHQKKNGSFFEVHREGDEAVKRLKDKVGREGEETLLTPENKEVITSETVEFSNELREELGDVVPKMRLDGPDGIRMAWVEGTPLSDLPLGQQMTLNPQAAAMVRQAEKIFGLDPGGTGLLEGGYRVMVDDNLANFILTSSGDLQWIDPIAVWPP